jgi:hypothetical protein
VLTDDHSRSHQGLYKNHESLKFTIMKVMCVEQPIAWLALGYLMKYKVPQVGDECTVNNTRTCSCGSHDVYDLEEFPSPLGFQTECFAVMPEADADDINEIEQEAIVPAPVIEVSPLSREEEAFMSYMNVYQITGDENRAAKVYYEVLNA